MKLTIKNYRSCAGNEGNAWSCTLYLDGKRAAKVSYDGNGGAPIFLWEKGRTELRRAFQAYIDSLPKRPLLDGREMVAPDMEWIVEEAANEHAENKRLKRWCRTQLVYRYEGDPKGSYITAKAKWEGNEDLLRAQVAKWAEADGKVVAEIINERFAKEAA